MWLGWRADGAGTVNLGASGLTLPRQHWAFYRGCVRQAQ
jgi:hypothetical protein